MYFLIIVAAIAVYIIMTRNKFNELQQMIKNGVSDIGVQSEALDRTLDKLIDIARNGYQKEIEGIAQLTAKDKLDRLLFLGQKYPDLKSIGEYSAIARKSEMLDKNLAAARQLVNGNIREYNTAINNFPGTIVASMFGFKEEAFIDAENYEKNKSLERRNLDLTK